MLPALWTAAQYEAVRAAFGPRRRQKQLPQIVGFMNDAVGFANTLNALSPTLSANDVDALLRDAADAAKSLREALSALKGEPRILLEGAGRDLAEWSRPEGQAQQHPEGSAQCRMQRLAKESAHLGYVYDQALGNPEYLLGRLDAYSNALQIHAAHARSRLKISRGARVSEDRATLLVQFLFEKWAWAFGAKPSTNPNKEFHRVARVVGNQYGLTIGSKTLKKANTDPSSNAHR